ncbi:MAG: 50S ribosomal protein L23 [Gammaproteobacteria bacterium]|jgi:large subunit ribosomal protein L23|nr:50S ribosomal protein L23 [Gammaproteobacteria bacterium]
MNQEILMKTLLAPHISEKSTRTADKHKQFVFKVADRATKPHIKQAVELMFKVKVDEVHVVNVKGKTKRAGARGTGRRSDWKKAYVSLQPGHDIDFTGEAK